MEGCTYDMQGGVSVMLMIGRDMEMGRRGDVHARVRSQTRDARRVKGRGGGEMSMRCHMEGAARGTERERGTNRGRDRDMNRGTGR